MRRNSPLISNPNLNEYSFRYNRSASGNLIFPARLSCVSEVSVSRRAIERKHVSEE